MFSLPPKKKKNGNYVRWRMVELTNFIVVIFRNIYVHQDIMLYSLNLCNITYKLYLNKAGNKWYWGNWLAVLVYHCKSCFLFLTLKCIADRSKILMEKCINRLGENMGKFVCTLGQKTFLTWKKSITRKEL